MKLLEKHYSYAFIIYLPIFLIALALVLFFPSQIVVTFKAHWLLLIGVISLAFTPIGKIQLGNHNKIKFHHWLLLVLLAQISVMFVYRGVMLIVTQGLPLQNSYNFPMLLSLTKNTFLWQWGLFPGAIYLLIGIALAYVGFYQSKPGKISITLMPLLKNKIDDSTSLTADFFTRTIAHFCIASSVGFTTLLILALLTNVFALPISTGLNLTTLLVTTLLLVAINTKEWPAVIRYFLNKNIPIAVIAVLFIVFSAGAIFILNAVGAEIVNIYSQWNKTLATFVTPHWKEQWLIFSGTWLLCWTPLIAGLIAYCSRGYQIRTVIFGGLLVILINNTLLAYLPNNTFLNYLLPLVGMLILLTLFLRKNYLMYQMRAIVPGTQMEKPRSVIFYTYALTQVAAFMLILYMPIGIFVLNILTFVLAFPLAIMLVISAVSFLFYSLKKRAH